MNFLGDTIPNQKAICKFYKKLRKYWLNVLAISKSFTVSDKGNLSVCLGKVVRLFSY